MLPRQRPQGTASALVVHEAHRPPAPVLRFVDQVAGTAADDIEFRFSQGVLTTFDVDVVHVAEPDLDVLLGTRGAPEYQRLLASMALAGNLRRHGIALVRTLLPGDLGPSTRRIERLTRRVLDGVTSAYVVIDESTEAPDPSRATTIPHAHFRDRFVGFPRAEQVVGRMLCILPDGLPDAATALLAVTRVTDVPDVTLRLAGTVPEALEPTIRSAVALHRAVASARFEPLSDGARVQEISSAELVVVPQTASLEAMQLVFLALSLDRPVLTPRTDAMRRLAQAVGHGWVHLSDGPITAEAVDTAFSSLREPEREQRPDMAGRDLATIHTAYASVFRAAASAQHARRLPRGTRRGARAAHTRVGSRPGKPPARERTDAHE